MLRKLFHVLKPGSPAVFEEPDFASVQLLDDPTGNPHSRVNAAICQMFRNAPPDKPLDSDLISKKAYPELY